MAMASEDQEKSKFIVLVNDILLRYPVSVEMLQQARSAINFSDSENLQLLAFLSNTVRIGLLKGCDCSSVIFDCLPLLFEQQVENADLDEVMQSINRALVTMYLTQAVVSAPNKDRLQQTIFQRA